MWLFSYRGAKIRLLRGAYQCWKIKKFPASQWSNIEECLFHFTQQRNMAFKRKPSSSFGLERRVRPRREDEWVEEPESEGSSSEDDDEVEEEGIRGGSDDEDDEEEEGQESEEASEDESEARPLRLFSQTQC
jgi:hypothetical protein